MPLRRLNQESEELREEAEAYRERDPPDLRIFSEVQRCHIRAGGHCGNYQFINTCVLDSLLVALHICYCTFGSIRDLFRSDRRMSVLMAFLNAGLYDKAKAYWLINVNLILNKCKFDMNGLVDVWSEVKDHLPMFEELVYAQYYFDEDRLSPALSIFEEKHQKTLRIFEEFGDVKLLGLSYRDPPLVLIHVDGRLDSKLPHSIDAYGRTYNLQSVLFSKMTEEVNHMVCCNKVLDRWILYDDNPEKSSFSDFNIQHADFKNEYVIHLAVYVKSDEENYRYINDEVPFGVPEDGGSVPGARPYFEDIYDGVTVPFGIPEVGHSNHGARPFNTVSGNRNIFNEDPFGVPEDGGSVHDAVPCDSTSRMPSRPVKTKND